MFEGIDSDQGATEEDVARVEKLLGIQFPAQLRKILLESNGGRLRYADFLVPGHPEEFFGIQLVLGITSETESSNILWHCQVGRATFTDRLIPIAITSSGDTLLLHRETGEVFFWDCYAPKGGKSIYRVAGSFDEFCAGLTEFG